MKKVGKIKIEEISKIDIENLRKQGKLLENEDLWTYLFYLTLATEIMKEENKEGKK